MDILAALNATPAKGAQTCKLQSFLDDIPEDADGRDDLLAAVADPKSRPANQLTLTFSALGHPISADIINDHRAKRCRCFR